MRLASVATLKPHPEASRVPMMRPPEYADFLADIKERGVRVALEVEPGTDTILDGRCRWTAAKDAGLDSVPVVDAPLNGDDSVIYMLRMASKRRHLTDDQRAMLADEERDWLAQKGRERQKAGKSADGEAGGRGKAKPRERSDPQVSQPDRARTQAAKAHNVSERKVRQAQQVKKANPSLAEKVKSGEVPLSVAIRQVEREQRSEQLEIKAKQAEQSIADQRKEGKLPWNIIHGDCLKELANLENGSVRLIFADPPYNIGVDYGEGTSADSLSDEEYLSWCRDWIEACRGLLARDGSLWVLIGDEYAHWFGCILEKLQLHRRAWVKWYETFGVNQSNNFNRCSRHLFYCVKDHKRFVFNPSAVNRPSDRQAKYGDSRADPDGKIWDDVWKIPRLIGTAKERIPEFPTQLPLELLIPIVGCASDPGDMVLDPFCGSATSGVASVTQGRKYIGIEKSKRFAQLAEMRMKGTSNDSPKGA